MNQIKTPILLVIMAITFAGLSVNPVVDATYNQDTTPTPTPYDECYECETNTTPNITSTPEVSETPTPEISVTPTPEVSETPTPTLTQTPNATPTDTPRGGTEEKKTEVLPASYAKTGASALNLILGLGLSLLSFGGVTYAKRNIS